MTDRTTGRIRNAVLRVRAEARSRWRRLPATVQRLTPFVVVLMVGLFLGSTLLGRGTSPDADGQDGIQAGHGHDDGADGVEWTCSMHPQIRQPGPGSCPICGMDLIPVSTGDYDGDHGDLPRLTVSDRAAALMAIQVWPAERRDLDGECGCRAPSGTTRRRCTTSWCGPRVRSSGCT
jgi:hypothetical protein